jgi:hypothetical protein
VYFLNLISQVPNEQIFNSCHCDSGQQFPMLHLSRGLIWRAEMGHGPKKDLSPLISSHMDVHSLRPLIRLCVCPSICWATSGVGVIPRRADVCLYGRMEFDIPDFVFPFRKTSMCDEMRGLCRLWGRCPKKGNFWKILKRQRSHYLDCSRINPSPNNPHRTTHPEQFPPWPISP